MPLDLTPIRKRLAVIAPVFWRDACAPEEGDEDPEEREFVANAPDDIAALLTEVERLHSELTGLRAYLTRSIADDLAGELEALEILDGLANEDMAMVDGWIAAMSPRCQHDAELERLRSELTGLRRYLTRSIATGIGGQDEPAEILAALSNEDAALIDRWTAAMENPAYAASDAARLRKDVWDLSESNVSLDRNLKDCVAWMSALEPVIGADLNALRLEPDRAAAVETVRQAVCPEPRFIVRLEPGVWIAEWKGDPGRTTVKASAKRFPTERSARRALSKARSFREFPLAAVECVK